MTPRAAFALALLLSAVAGAFAAVAGRPWGVALWFGGLGAVAVLLAWPRRYGRLDTWLWQWAYRRYLDSGAWRSTARNVQRRDRFTCQECGLQVPEVRWRHCGLEYIMLEGSRLQVHHLPGTYRRFWWYLLAPRLGLRENPDNLRTYCRGCHLAAHGRED